MSYTAYGLQCNDSMTCYPEKDKKGQERKRRQQDRKQTIKKKEVKK